MKQFSENLKRILSERKITQTELAKYLKFSKVSVNRYLSGMTEPGMDTLVKISRYLNVSIDFLLTGDECDNKSGLTKKERITVLEIINRIKSLRRARRITQQQMAYKLSMSTINYRKIESNSKSPRLTLENYLLICDALNVEYNYFLNVENYYHYCLTPEELQILNDIISTVKNRKN